MTLEELNIKATPPEMLAFGGGGTVKTFHISVHDTAILMNHHYPGFSKHTSFQLMGVGGDDHQGVVLATVRLTLADGTSVEAINGEKLEFYSSHRNRWERDSDAHGKAESFAFKKAARFLGIAADVDPDKGLRLKDGSYLRETSGMGAAPRQQPRPAQARPAAAQAQQGRPPWPDDMEPEDRAWIESLAHTAPAFTDALKNILDHRGPEHHQQFLIDYGKHLGLAYNEGSGFNDAPTQGAPTRQPGGGARR